MATQTQRIGKRTVKIFKIQNRQGYAALCDDHLTEGSTQNQALDRMLKALARTERKAKKK
ncbi:MAG TPA: hypothetical protein P5160_02205 [Candidatus Omnitrophota bacterium]|jgi:hypothetical protein|nr:hypothetical protein [Candidatus Omnitrophota bacterium]